MVNAKSIPGCFERTNAKCESVERLTDECRRDLALGKAEQGSPELKGFSNGVAALLKSCLSDRWVVKTALGCHEVEPHQASHTVLHRFTMEDCLGWRIVS